MLAAAAAWDGLAADLHSTGTAYQSLVSRLVGESWLGPSSQAMAASIATYVSWLAATAAQAEQTATQAKAAAAAYEAAFAMTVPPSVIAANRAQLLMLVATNILGQNTAAIAAVEAHYAEMWVQDAVAMHGYAMSSAQATQLPQFVPPSRTTNPAGQSEQAAAIGNDAGTSAGAGVQQTMSQLMGMNGASQAAAAADPLPAQAVPAVTDLLGLNALAVAGFSVSDIGVALSAGAWASANESTRLILAEQSQLEYVQYDILHAIDLYSPLTPSRPGAYVPSPLPPASAAVGEAVSVGRLSVPMSWAANAPEIRSLAYTVPTLAASAAAAPAAGAGTAFSEMALAGMGGSALAGAVKRGGQETVETAASRKQGKPAQELPDNPVTGIAAEIREFAELRDCGLITDEEYNAQKQRLLGR